MGVFVLLQELRNAFLLMEFKIYPICIYHVGIFFGLKNCHLTDLRFTQFAFTMGRLILFEELSPKREKNLNSIQGKGFPQYEWMTPENLLFIMQKKKLETDFN